VCRLPVRLATLSVLRIYLQERLSMAPFLREGCRLPQQLLLLITSCSSVAYDPPSSHIRSPLSRYSLTRAEFAEVGALLLLPFLAASWLGGVAMTILIPVFMLAASIAAYVIFAADKKKARQNGWRIPEFTMHLLEAAGGWPGSYLAQRRFRHKITKRRYQMTFWLIVAAHQFLAFGALTHWRFLL